MIGLEVGAAPRAALVVAAISRWQVAATGGVWQADAVLKGKPETGMDAGGITHFRLRVTATGFTFRESAVQPSAAGIGC